MARGGVTTYRSHSPVLRCCRWIGCVSLSLFLLLDVIFLPGLSFSHTHLCSPCACRAFAACFTNLLRQVVANDHPFFPPALHRSLPLEPSTLHPSITRTVLAIGGTDGEQVLRSVECYDTNDVAPQWLPVSPTLVRCCQSAWWTGQRRHTFTMLHTVMTLCGACCAAWG